MLNKIKSEIFDFFPSFLLKDNIISGDVVDAVQEIRVRVGQAINIRGSAIDLFVGDILKPEHILKLLENFSDNSIYAVQSELNLGYITIKGGHRIGVSGTCIIEDGKVKNIKYISSLNIRVAREIKNCSDSLFKYIIRKNEFNNTLILSPPRVWKNNIA